MTYTTYDQLPLIMSVEEMAEILGIGRNTAYDLIRKRKIKGVHVGRQIRVTKEALRTFLSKD